MATATHSEAVREDPRGSAPGEKGLKSNAISFVSNVVIGTASVAPAYSLAATLGVIDKDHPLIAALPPQEHDE